MKSAKPSTGTSNRLKGEASTAAFASGDQPATEEVPVDPTPTVDPATNDDIVDPIVAPPLSLYAKMETFITT